MNLAKLYPPPWEVVDEGDGRVVIVDANKKYIPGLSAFYGHVAMAAASKIVLIRNAEDVMMRRGWFAAPTHGKWNVLMITKDAHTADAVSVMTYYKKRLGLPEILENSRDL